MTLYHSIEMQTIIYLEPEITVAELVQKSTKVKEANLHPFPKFQEIDLSHVSKMSQISLPHVAKI